MRRRRPGVLLLVLAAVAAAVVGCGDDDDGAGGAATTTTMATGGIEIAAPEGWLAIPLPVYGFGLAVPGGWEATRLDAEGLSSLGQAAPVVPGFVVAAHSAAQSGAVFYAAGVNRQDQVTDLKVRAVLDSGITDDAGLEGYARELATAAGLASPTIEVVPGAAHPTVDIRYRAQGQRVADDDPEATVTVDVEGTERLVLSPRGIVFSLIVTSEDPAQHDEVAERIFATLAFPPG